MPYCIMCLENLDVEHPFPVLGTWEVFHDGQWVPGTAQDFVGRVVKGRKARPFLSCGFPPPGIGQFIEIKAD